MNCLTQTLWIGTARGPKNSLVCGKRKSSGGRWLPTGWRGSCFTVPSHISDPQAPNSPSYSTSPSTPTCSCWCSLWHPQASSGSCVVEGPPTHPPLLHPWRTEHHKRNQRRRYTENEPEVK